MFAKQTEQLERLRGRLPDEAIDVFKAMLGQCQAHLEHRGPVDIRTAPDRLGDGGATLTVSHDDPDPVLIPDGCPALPNPVALRVNGWFDWPQRILFNKRPVFDVRWATHMFPSVGSCILKLTENMGATTAGQASAVEVKPGDGTVTTIARTVYDVDSQFSGLKTNDYVLCALVNCQLRILTPAAGVPGNVLTTDMLCPADTLYNTTALYTPGGSLTDSVSGDAFWEANPAGTLVDDDGPIDGGYYFDGSTSPTRLRSVDTDPEEDSASTLYDMFESPWSIGLWVKVDSATLTTIPQAFPLFQVANSDISTELIEVSAKADGSGGSTCTIKFSLNGGYAGASPPTAATLGFSCSYLTVPTDKWVFVHFGVTTQSDASAYPWKGWLWCSEGTPYDSGYSTPPNQTKEGDLAVGYRSVDPTYPNWPWPGSSGDAYASGKRWYFGSLSSGYQLSVADATVAADDLYVTGEDPTGEFMYGGGYGVPYRFCKQQTLEAAIRAVEETYATSLMFL